MQISEYQKFKIEKTLTSGELKNLTAVYDIDHEKKQINITVPYHSDCVSLLKRLQGTYSKTTRSWIIRFEDNLNEQINDLGQSLAEFEINIKNISEKPQIKSKFCTLKTITIDRDDQFIIIKTDGFDEKLIVFIKTIDDSRRMYNSENKWWYIKLSQEEMVLKFLEEFCQTNNYKFISNQKKEEDEPVITIQKLKKQKLFK